MVSFFFKGLPHHPTMQFDPNTPEAVDFRVDLPEEPIPNDVETCLDYGPIGWTIYGVALYNPFTIEGNNAVEGPDAEMFDECQGHADMFGVYHYHQLPDNCVFQGVDTGIHGIARDGFPIYGQYKEDGTLVQEFELDKCHGRCGADGKYRYHMTKTYPYILGCYRGTPMDFESTVPQFQPMGDGGPPPPPARKRRQAEPEPECAYNTVVGPNYEFQTCSGKWLANSEMVYFRSQILKHPYIGEYCNIFEQYWSKIWYKNTFLGSVIQKFKILKRENSLVFSNTRIPVCGTQRTDFSPNSFFFFFIFIYFTLSHNDYNFLFNFIWLKKLIHI